MIKLLALSVCVLFCSLLLKDNNKTFSVLLSLSGCIMIIVGVSNELIRVSKRVENMLEPLGTQSYLKLMLKVLALTLLTQAVSDMCRDNGQNALAGVCEFGAKAAVAVLVLPLFETVIKIVGGIVK